MALMKIQDGKIIAALEKINETIAPSRIENFVIPAAMAKIAENSVFDETLKKELITTLPTGLLENYRKNNLTYLSTFVIRAGISNEMKQKLSGYAQPHKNNYDEVHHFINGAVLIGIVTKLGVQVLIALSAGEKIYIPEGSEHWAIMTDDDWVTVISSKSKPPENQVAQLTKTEVAIIF